MFSHLVASGMRFLNISNRFNPIPQMTEIREQIGSRQAQLNQIKGTDSDFPETPFAHPSNLHSPEDVILELHLK